MRGHALRQLAWLLAGASSVGAVMSLFGLPLGDWFLYVAYAAGWTVLPGTAVYLLTASGRVLPLSLLTQGTIVGLCMETVAFLVLAMADRPTAIRFYPLVFFLLWAVRGRRLLGRVDWSAGAPFPQGPALIATVVLVLFALGAEQFVPVLDHHAAWPIAFARAGLAGWPLADPFALGETLHYHYLYYLHFTAAHLVTGQSLTLLATRTAVPAALALMVLLLFDVARGQVRREWLALLVPLQVLVSPGYATDFLFPWAGHVVAASSFLVPATLASHLVFVALLREIEMLLNGAAVLPGRLIVIGLMTLAASGFRSSVLPVLGAATAFFLLVELVSGRPLPRRALFLLSLICVSFVAGLALFFGFGGPNAATGELYLRPLSPSNVSHLATYPWLRAHGWPETPAVAVVTLATQLLRLTFLLPGFLSFFWMRRQGAIATRPLRTLLVGSWLAALAYSMLFWTRTSMGTFLELGTVGAALLAVAGLDALLDRSRDAWRPALAMASAVLLVLHVGDVLRTARRLFESESLAARRRQPPSLIDSASDLAVIADALETHDLERTIFVVAGPLDGCRRNAELRLTATHPRFRLLASSHVVGGYATRRGAGPSVLDRAAALQRLGKRGPERWEAIRGIRESLPPGLRLGVVDCHERGPRRPVHAGAEPVVEAGNMRVYLF